MDALDESLAIDKLALCKTHVYTMDTHLENFDSLTQAKHVAEGAQVSHALEVVAEQQTAE